MLFSPSKLIGMEVELHDKDYRVVGEVLECKMESCSLFDRKVASGSLFDRNVEYTVRFNAVAIEHYIDGKLAVGIGHAPKKFSLTARKVIFNPPATIVLWEDGTKTVVKCDKDDTFDEMKGVALCYMKKALGNTSRELNKALRKGKEHASV